MEEERNHIGNIHVLEEEGIYKELDNKRQEDVQCDMLDTMRILREDLDSLKDGNVKLLKAEFKQE